MAFFPTSPSNNATTIVNGITYIYNTSLQAWKIVPSSVTTGNTFVQIGFPLTPFGLVTDAVVGGLGQESLLTTWDNRTTVPANLVFANNTIELDAGYLT